MRTKRFGKTKAAIAMMLATAMIAAAAPVSAAGMTLYTPYTSISVTPGDSLNYSIELVNDEDTVKTADLSFSTGAAGWEYELTAGGHPIRQIAVKPHESQSVNLSLTVPLEVSKGDYNFTFGAGAFGTLPLKVGVSEQGTYKSELTTEQPNRQGHADSTFSYTLEMNNRTASKQQYALTAETPAGWDARFTVDGSNVTGVEVEANASKSITLILTPADNAAAQSYKIPVHAVSGSSSADVEVEAVITGTYGIQLTTSDERLSANVTAGKTRKLELTVKNTGSADLSDISLTATTPADWEVSFEPKTMASLKAGESKPVTATITSSGKALAGDYVVGLTARSSEKSADAAIRVTVKSSVLWGWVGILIILAVLAGIYGLFRKYGRR